jgi:hypothetical protein
MTMGGKGGGTQIPEFVKEAQKMTGERSQQLHDISSPIMNEGVKQIQSLITTGGPGAQVPILANTETGYQRAFDTANKQIEEQMARGGGGAPRDPSFNRINELHNINMQTALKGIRPAMAAPFIGSAMGSALGGGQLAQAGYQSAAQALASGVRRPQQGSGGNDIMGAFQQLGKLYASGGFSGLGGGGGGAAFKEWTSSDPNSLNW